MEIQLDLAGMAVSPTAFFQLEETTRIRSSIGVTLSDHSYLPKVDEPRADWVASVAVPAFKTLARMGVLAPRFCTVGTGAGLDVLAAVEILQARSVGFTDLHEDVLANARRNIQENLLDQSVELIGGVGDILSPLAGRLSNVDVIYENLPNIPMDDTGDLADGQTSSTFITKRDEEIPSFVEKSLMTLHYLALQQARPILRVGGRVLSSIGGRVPLSEALALAGAAGYNGNILTYTWKVQSEPHDVVGGYARWEREGMGPFHFYPVGVLHDTFGSMSVAQAGARSLDIEERLAPHAMSAADALELVKKNEKVGHTVMILDSVKIPDSLN